MDRKPDDGCEVQNSCCGESGIMMRLKIEKGTLSSADDLTTLPIDTDGALDLDSNNNAGTNTVLELTKPWWHTNRVVLADSAFASVRTAAKLNKKHGIYWSR